MNQLFRNRHYALGFAILFVAFQFIIVSNPSWFHLFEASNVIPTLLTFTCLFVLGVKGAGQQQRGFFLLLSFNSLCYLIGLLIWHYDLWKTGKIPDSPNLADLFWSLQISFLTSAFIYQMCKGRSLFQGMRFIYDTIIIVLATLAIWWEYVIGPNLSELRQNFPLEMIAFLAVYPVGDMVLLICLFLMHLSFKDLFTKPAFIFHSFSILAYVLGDTCYFYLYASGTYTYGAWLEPIYSLAFLLSGLAGIYSIGKEKESLVVWERGQWKRAETLARYMLPYLSMLLLCAFLFKRIENWDAIVLFSALMAVIVAVRQVTVLLDNEALLQKLQKTLLQAEYLANYDELSELPNRRNFTHLLNWKIDQVGREQRKMAILFMDLNRFKFVNDSYGHHIGDLLIKEVAKRLKETMPASDVVARLGGDEFTVLIPRFHSLEEIKQKAEAIINRLSEPFLIEQIEIQTSTSIGITLFPDDGYTVADLLKNADSAMYAAKESDGCRYCFFTALHNQELVRRITLEKELRKAIEQKRLSLHYQPQIDSRNLTLSGVEALVRWKTGNGTVISPGEFIPIAEETGLIVPMGEWVLRTACTQAKQWMDDGMPPIKMAVNVSPKQLALDHFVPLLLQILQETAFPAHLLVLEITESIAIRNPQEMIKKLIEVKKFGVQIAMDDFGTGYSSLEYLRQFQVDTIKISQAFIRDITEKPDHASIVTAIIAMAASMQLSVVVEGVETEEQYRILKEQDCDFIQGYYFYRPMSNEEFEKCFLVGSIPNSAG